MTGKVQPAPDGYHTVTPFLVVDGAAGAIAFYIEAFGAKELNRSPLPDGTLAHAEIQIGDSPIMLVDEHPEEGGGRSPKHFGGSPVSLYVYLEDVDAVVARAVAAGAKLTQAVADQYYGDRQGSVTDPWGHIWHIATHVEDVPPEEIARREKERMAKGGPA